MVYKTIETDGQHPIDFYSMDLANAETLDGTSASDASSSAYTSPTPVILIGPEAFHVTIAASPTATTSNIQWPGGLPLPIRVTAGMKVAVIKASGATAGIVYAIPLLDE